MEENAELALITTWPFPRRNRLPQGEDWGQTGAQKEQRTPGSRGGGLQTSAGPQGAAPWRVPQGSHGKGRVHSLGLWGDGGRCSELLAGNQQAARIPTATSAKDSPNELE